MTTFVDFFLGLGYLVVYYGGPIISYRVLQAICAGLTLVFMAGFSVLPESPIYLASRGQSDKALDILTNLRKSKATAEQELADILVKFLYTELIYAVY